MELAASLEPFFSPASSILPISNANQFVARCQAYHDNRAEVNRSEIRWKSSALNPCNRLDRHLATSTTRWRIDGCTGLGRQLFAVPIFMMPRLPMKRIDILIPCQSHHPDALRRQLGSSYLYGMTGPSVNQLGISQYLAQVLDRWATGQPYFEEIYRSLPFGSIIVLENIVHNLEDVKLRFIPNLKLVRSLSTAELLQEMWAIPDPVWPPTIPLEKLQFDKQLNGNVSLVRIPHLIGSSRFIFKTNVRSMKHLYHELKLLLMIAPHINITPKPRFLVSTEDQRSKSGQIVGFILDYYAYGNLRDVLDSGVELTIEKKLTWSIQILKALIHVHNGPAKFYSDLKPDNIVFSSHLDNIILIDFEQAGNWDTFRAPEIFYADWMEKLSHHEELAENKRTRYKILTETLIGRALPPEDTYQNPASGYYYLWNTLSSSEQESAMVYSFGKILWCIFEGCSHTHNSMDEKYEIPVHIEFPQFTMTPHTVQNLVRRCTLGAPEWSGQEAVRIVRQGDRFVSVTESSSGPRVTSSPQSVIEDSRRLWESRILRMEHYMETKARWTTAASKEGDELLLGFPSRPNLAEVLHTLDYEFADERKTSSI